MEFGRSTLFFLVLFFGFSLITASAATNQFTIGLSVVADSSAPTTPTGLVATAISSSQIDLSWTASTDNVAVSGYVIRRGGAIVGTTTTGTTYSDTGLSASTLYTYTVQAFDASFNYSSQSSSASATTNAGGPPPDTTPPTVSTLSPSNNATGVSTTTSLVVTFSESVNKFSGNVLVKRYSDDVTVDTINVSSAQVSVLGAVATMSLSAPLGSSVKYYVTIPAGAFADTAGNAFAGISGNSTWVFTTADTVPPVISSVSATTTTTTATTTFLTDEPALATFSWGTTTDYALGQSSEVIYDTNHSFVLSGLTPATTYYFKILAKDAGNNQSIYTGTFTTLTPPVVPDTTPPANPSGFTAVPSVTSIALSWTNPTDPDFSAVRIMRSASTYPTDQNDGVLVYQGLAQSTTDTGLTASTTYYYTAFARDVTGNYSSGAIAHATTNSNITPPPPPPPPGPEPEPTPPPPPGGSPTPSPEGTTTNPLPDLPASLATSTGPFGNFTSTGTPNVGFTTLELTDFIFTQLSSPEERLPVTSGNVVNVGGLFPVRVAIPYEKLPEVLKTVVISVADARDNTKTSTIILRVNDAKTLFEGVLDAFPVNGKYPFVISMFDYENKGLVRIPGVFIVAGKGNIVTSLVPTQVVEFVTNTAQAIQEPVRTITPVAAPVGVAVGAAQGVIIATNVGSFYDLYLVLLKFLGLLTGVFRRKKKEPWGVVYDSITKRPLDPAYVVAQMRQDGKSQGEAITDLDGRYGFVLKPGEYVIVANKTHYKFPSEKLQGRAKDELYDNLYFGKPFAVNEGGIIEYNIPLDPIEFDWNEFAKNHDKVFKVYSRKDKLRILAFNTIFFFGFALSFVTLILTPSIINGSIIGIYVAILIFQIVWRVSHKLARVINTKTGIPIPFAIIKVWAPGLDTVVKKSVADENGRFYFLVSPGTYYVTVEEKLPDGTYHEVLRTKEMNLKKGVISENILV